MENGGSPFTVDDLLVKLRCGEAGRWISNELHGSIFWYDDNTAEIGHMSGKWTDADGSWIVEKMREAGQRRGLTEIRVNGRKGWQRFLRMKGFLT